MYGSLPCLASIQLRNVSATKLQGMHPSHSRADEEPHLSQPAVSVQIKLLEKVIGLPLFEQMGKHIHLTEAGRELVIYSRIGFQADFINRSRAPG